MNVLELLDTHFRRWNVQLRSPALPGHLWILPSWAPWVHVALVSCTPQMFVIRLSFICDHTAVVCFGFEFLLWKSLVFLLTFILGARKDQAVQMLILWLNPGKVKPLRGAPGGKPLLNGRWLMIRADSPRAVTMTACEAYAFLICYEAVTFAIIKGQKWSQSRIIFWLLFLLGVVWKIGVDFQERLLLWWSNNHIARAWLIPLRACSCEFSGHVCSPVSRLSACSMGQASTGWV